MRLVHNALNAVIGLIPDRLAPCVPNIVAVRRRLASDSALTELRGLASFAEAATVGDHLPTQTAIGLAKQSTELKG